MDKFSKPSSSSSGSHYDSYVPGRTTLGSINRKPLPTSNSEPVSPLTDGSESVVNTVNSSQHPGYQVPSPYQQFPHYNTQTSNFVPPLYTDATPSTGAEVLDTFVEPPTPHEPQSSPFQAQDAPRNSPGKQKLTKAQKETNMLRPKPANITPGQSPATSPELRGRLRSLSGSNLQPPPTLTDLGQPRAQSQARDRPASPYYHSSDGGSSGGEGKAKKRKSWMPGSRSRATSAAKSNAPKAWIIAMDGGGNPYDTSPMMKGTNVPELWDESGDVYVYLYPQSANRGPSFRVSSRTISGSKQLMSLTFGAAFGMRARARSFDGRSSLLVEDATRNLHLGTNSPPMSPPLTSSDGSSDSIRSLELPKQGNLYFPTRMSHAKEHAADEDEEYFVSVRNLFAFLTCQPLVATKRHPTVFSIFILISGHLSRLGFTNFDGSTFGETVVASFNFYLEAFQLADVRRSREKTMEAIILGERLRSIELYNEAFAHAVGKYKEITAMKSELFTMISAASRNRIERSWIDLGQRNQAVTIRLEHFEFPALFSGMAASTTSEESRLVRFKTWKSHFLSMRRFVMGYYKELYGAWPPRASSKKNSFAYSGLNRLVLRNLYLDLCTLYDFLVDRSNLTTRSTDATSSSEATAADPTLEALRKLLHESDHSSPPVQPPIPFDVPLLPSIVTLEPNIHHLPPKLQSTAETRKLKDYEMKLLLARSHNLDSQLNTPFLKMFMEFEEKEAKNKNSTELAELRIGVWLFIYVVIQSLPMLVVDSPNLQFAQGVETFLCQPAKGLPPWMDESGGQVKRNWYGVAGGQGMVSLPSDVVDYGVEGIFRASHCWTVADQWIKGLEFHDPEVEEYALSPTTPHSAGGFDGDWNEPPAADRRRSRNRLSMGLEQLPIPAGAEMPWLSSSDAYASPQLGDGAFDSGNYHDQISPTTSSGQLSPPGVMTPPHPQQQQHQPQYIGMPTSSTLATIPHSTTMPDLRVIETAPLRSSHRYATPPESAQVPQSAHARNGSAGLGRPRSGSSDGRMIVRSGEVKEVKGFDAILADMGKEQLDDKKGRRKSFLGF